MNWFQNWLQRFMQGRYGGDQFTFGLLIGYFCFTMLGSFFKVQLLSYIGVLLLVYCWFRILSRNTYKRSLENTKFLHIISPMRSWFHLQQKKFADRNIYKYYKCPKCKQQLRVPKGKGQVVITCPKCKTKFEKYT